MSKEQACDVRRPVLGAVLALIAAVLTVGGAYLASLGGSWYYVLAGLIVAGSAYLSFKGDRRAVWAYGAMLAGTAAWAIWERGFDPWALQVRLAAPFVLGLWVVAPCLKRRAWLWTGSATLVLAGLLITNFIADEGISPDSKAQVSNTSGASLRAAEWQHYGNDLAGTRFSPASQINVSNVGNLEPAWTYRTGVIAGMGFQATPIMVGDTLYFCTANNKVIALDPETGTRRWEYDPKVNLPAGAACRGVAYFKSADRDGPCAERILSATTDARLIALDAGRGTLCPDFGVRGIVDLKHRMGQVDKGYYYVSSAPLVADGKVVVGGWVIDGQHVGEPSGVIRAFDAETGQFAWAWDMDRPGFHGEPEDGETYSRGTANSWGTMSADPELGMIYVPMGNATPDYWGAHRSEGSEKYSSSVVALDSASGEVRWSYQTVHHDLWDYDVAAQPTLIDLTVEGARVPALIQATKQGQIFVLDRRSGNPIVKVEERPVPQGPAPGDFLSPTQPFSVGMPAFDDDLLSERKMWGITPLDHLWCRIRFREARYDGIMTPPGLRPTITYPSYLGGVGWWGVSVDPNRRLMVVNWNRMANYTQMVTREEAGDIELSKDGGVHAGRPVPQLGTPFALRTGPFLSPLDVPCTEPPFGKIAVVDLDSRKVSWSRPLGTSRDSGPFDVRSRIPLPMGMPNIGGSLTTAGGVVFIAATQERAIRAFDVNEGKMLWSARLPAGGNATPMTYISSSGRQFVVIAAGGHLAMRSGESDTLMAFALPKPSSESSHQ